jgi:SAM-dependent methyltransferase
MKNLTKESQSCRICDNSQDNHLFTAKEMMFGNLDEFQYLECSSCGCVQLLDVPDSFEKYYPSNYYSFQPKKKSLKNTIDFWVKKQIALYRLDQSIIGDKLLFLNKRYLKWLSSECNLTFESNILDVGCGKGKLLKELSLIGFNKLTGVDPFIEKDIQYGDIAIYKKYLSEITGAFDFIMLHHSFEHMLNPAEVLNDLTKILAPEGVILIRIPVSDSYVYRTYGADWVELDAPRHTFLHTKKSMEILLSNVGLRVRNITYDSSKFEIVGSEKHKRGIPSTKNVDLFNKKKLREFDDFVEKLNKDQDAGRACFYISR